MHEQRGRINTRLNPKRNIFCNEPTYKTWKSVKTCAKKCHFGVSKSFAASCSRFEKEHLPITPLDFQLFIFLLSSWRYVQPLSLSLDDEFRWLTSGKNTSWTQGLGKRTILYICISRHISEGLCRTMSVHTYTYAKYRKHKVYLYTRRINYVYSNIYIYITMYCISYKRICQIWVANNVYCDKHS